MHKNLHKDLYSKRNKKKKYLPVNKITIIPSDKEDIENLTKRYDDKGLRYGDVKKELYEKIMDYFRLCNNYFLKVVGN